MFASPNRSHVDILPLSFIKLGYILWIPLKWSVNFLKSPTSTCHFSNSTGSSATNRRFFTDVASESSCALSQEIPLVVAYDRGEPAVSYK